MENQNNKLSSEEDWNLHWKDVKSGNIDFIRFDDLTSGFPAKGTFIEIGGFPGIYSIYFHKKFGYSPTMLDFITDHKVVNFIEESNGVQAGTIEIIKGDFFSFTSSRKFSVVFSWGFIEHFRDIRDVVRRHWNLVEEGGYLLIGLPNLKGLPGWFTKLVDRTFLDIHNLECMEIKYLSDICNSLSMTDAEVFYYGKPKIWINASSKYNNKVVRFLVWAVNMFLRYIPLRNRFFAPHLIIKAKKAQAGI
jgi:SAM-dependent methyltransferase